ncbi:hypothetical protein AZE42_04692 [Rhizopogon vesiculosus]|uniref:DOC domain-containing protein n=1 Tax=Rhizopogon vesiculosus TaxID=180088 RepID=A0A1J8Q389_9AGAM|nr:hypothetical protein AZE42_04692 [Rhizopogon vesiculosus]
MEPTPIALYKFSFGAEHGSADGLASNSNGPCLALLRWSSLARWQFRKPVATSVGQDDSYTPLTLTIRAGTGPSALQDVRVASLEKPDGWITFDVSSEPDEDGNSSPSPRKLVHATATRYREDAPDSNPFLWKLPEFKMYERLR